MAQEVKAPNLVDDHAHAKVFLAGSIDMGAAEDWQARLAQELDELDIIIYNPRRDDWDSSWEQTIENEKFFEQVSWELEKLEDSDVILYYFDPNGKAPITLLELGLHILNKNIVVCCPPGYWRRGNLEVLTHRLGITLHDNLDDFIQASKSAIQLAMRKYPNGL